MLQLRTLGGLELDLDGEVVLHRRSKPLCLLAFLALGEGRPVPREQLAALLWGDRPEARARASLREALFQLRHAAGPALEVDRATARVVTGRLAVDARRFEQALVGGDPEAAIPLYGGPFLPGTEDTGTGEFRTWVDGQRARLRSLHLDALERATRGAEERGDWTQAVRWAETWAAESPLDPVAHRALARSLSLAGNPAAAQARWDAFLGTWVAEHGEASQPPEDAGAGAVPAPRVASPATSSAVFSPDLVGRERAFRLLTEGWERVREGEGAAFLLAGEPGIGKSRLAAEFLKWAGMQRPCPLVLQGRAFPCESDVPFALASTLLSGLRVGPGLSGAPAPALAEVAEVVPSLRERYPDLPAARGGEDAFVAAVKTILEDVAAETPVVLFADDLHLADPPSRRLLEALLRRPPAGTLHLLATRAGSGMPTDVGRQIDLPLLSFEEIDHLVASMVEMRPHHRQSLTRAAHQASGGNPLFAVEVVSGLVDQGRLSPGPDGLWRLEGPVDVRDGPTPRLVSEALEWRLSQLPREAAGVLATAALLWPDTDPELLRLVAGLDEEETSAGLEELLVRRLIRPPSDPRLHYEFAHDLLRHHAYDRIPPHRRSELHAAAARVLGRRGRRSVAVSRAVAHHRSRTGHRVVAPPRRRMVSAAVALVLVVVVLAAVGMVRWGPEPTPVLAVGFIEEHGAGEDGPVGPVVRDLLGTSLARIPGLSVVASSRLQELTASTDSGLPAGESLAAAARRAGAGELIGGALLHLPEGGWRLDLRRMDLETGMIRGTATLSAADPFTLVDRATASVARDLGRLVPSLGIAEVTTGSIAAYQQYAEGLRAYHRGDQVLARELFEGALEEDPTFAMAAFQAALAAWATDAPRALEHLVRARALAGGATDRERLVILGVAADLLDEPALAAYADSLQVFHGHDPIGFDLQGRAAVKAGAFMEAAGHFRRVLEMAPLQRATGPGPSRAWDAADRLVGALAMADSLTAAEAVAREWAEVRPGSARPWMKLRDVLEQQGRFEEALEAAATARALRSVPTAYDRTYPALVDLKRERFTRADAELRRHIRTGDPEVAKQARWLLVISLRWQGRREEALAEARRYRALGGGQGGDGAFPPNDALAEAQVLHEIGRFREAAHLFDSLATTFSTGASASHSARQRSWMLTHAADAWAAAGDTARLTTLVDSIQRLGRESGSGRDRILHHHVRGLLLLARGDTVGAEGELRRALYSVRGGFTRTNHLLAGVLLARGRPGEAARLLEAIFRAPVDVSNFYLARTEVRVLLGQVWLAAGRPDLAALQLDLATRAWRDADPLLGPRRLEVLDALERARALEHP